ncbi:MAG: SusD/RagB family nutrient-binding outer membrane lipoprotein [Rikenellaceae bacterium]|nr:SusD/RagB family nutrient-binding outer membrane lipoprotein [Rikenellaceae bacterium]
MNKILKYISGIVLLSTVVGCTSGFEKFNTNPYEPATLPVTSFFPAMIDCLASPEENPCQRNNTFWACFGGYVTAPHSWSRNTLFSTYSADDDWNKWTVNWYYEHFYTSWFEVARLTENQGYYYQMAQLLRVYTMQMVASLQGPMSYSQIAAGQFYVPYDNEETAWKAMFDDLDAAIVEIQSAVTSTSRPLEDVDRVYGGDNSKWLKFANTLKLRMAMRISNADPEYARQKAEEAVAGGVMTSTSDSAYDLLNGRYPNGYYQISAGWGGEAKANASIVSYMNGYNDPRREKYFTAQTAVEGSDPYMGVRSGIQGMVKNDYINYSGLIYEESNGKTAPMPVMLAAEAAFLRAEGALKGWNMGGTAQDLYEQGVRLSFEEWGASGVDAYLADNTSTPADYTDAVNTSNSIANKSTITIAWDNGASNEKKLERIITQKWIAGYPNGLEGWSDFRRTGYPYIFPPKNNLSTQGCTNERGQRRLRFSVDEYSNNRANVTAAVQMLSNGTDSDNTDLWWALKSGSKY